MGRPPRKNILLKERRDLARMIDDALKAGQRGDGTRKQFWRPWTDAEFARKVSQGASTVSGWRDCTNPARPGNIVPILKAFYGDVPEYAAAKQEMLRAWRRADDIDADDPPDSRAIATKPFGEVVEVAYLLVNQPTSDNRGNLLVPYTMRMRCDENREVTIKVDSVSVPVTIDIGLSKSLFMVTSKHWQPLQDTIVTAQPGSLATRW